MDTRALSRIAPPTRGIAASFARRGIAVSAPPRPCHFRSRLRRRGDLVALGLDGLCAGLFEFVHCRKAKIRGRVGQRSNGRCPTRRCGSASLVNYFAGILAPHDAEKMFLKRFMPVARGTRPAYRNKTRGELVFWGQSTT